MYRNTYECIHQFVLVFFCWSVQFKRLLLNEWKKIIDSIFFCLLNVCMYMYFQYSLLFFTRYRHRRKCEQYWKKKSHKISNARIVNWYFFPEYDKVIQQCSSLFAFIIETEYTNARPIRRAAQHIGMKMIYMCLWCKAHSKVNNNNNNIS